jgi:hypothetical protein
MRDPGTALYVPTPLGTPLEFHPGVSVDDLVLEWDAEGSFSKKCAVCWRVRFQEGRVRTLACGHSYCHACIVACARPNDEVSCPLCRRVCFLSEHAEGLERVYNDLLVAHQLATLQYQCPFEGCEQRLARVQVDAHLDACPCRLFVCTHGCEGAFTRTFLHQRPQDCLAYLRAQVASLTEAVARLETRVGGQRKRLRS